MSGALPPLLQYAFMAWYSVKAQGLYLYLYCIYRIITNILKYTTKLITF